MSDKLPPPPPPRSTSETFSGLDHMAALTKARLAGEPDPPARDPLHPSGSDPFKDAYLNRIQEN